MAATGTPSAKNSSRATPPSATKIGAPSSAAATSTQDPRPEQRGRHRAPAGSRSPPPRMPRQPSARSPQLAAGEREAQHHRGEGDRQDRLGQRRSASSRRCAAARRSRPDELERGPEQPGRDRGGNEGDEPPCRALERRRQRAACRSTDRDDGLRAWPPWRRDRRPRGSGSRHNRWCRGCRRRTAPAAPARSPAAAPSGRAPRRSGHPRSARPHGDGAFRPRSMSVSFVGRAVVVAQTLDLGDRRGRHRLADDHAIAGLGRPPAIPRAHRAARREPQSRGSSSRRSPRPRARGSCRATRRAASWATCTTAGFIASGSDCQAARRSPARRPAAPT